MKILRYLNREVMTHMVAVSFVLLVIIFSGRFVKYLAEAATGDIAADILLPVMFYRLPGFLELIIPLGLFIGILMSYGRMYVESEMVVLSACGISPGSTGRIHLGSGDIRHVDCWGAQSVHQPTGCCEVRGTIARPSFFPGFECTGFWPVSVTPKR